MYLKVLNKEDSLKEYNFLVANPSENGFVNNYYDHSYSDFCNKDIPSLLNDDYVSKDIVKNTYYFLYDDSDNIVGLFKLRHYLNESLINGAGHIGYLIAKDYRNKGYAKKGLELLIAKIKEENLVKEKELYFQTNINNIYSLKVLLSLNAYIHHRDDNNIYLRIRLDDLILNSNPILEYSHDFNTFLSKEDFNIKFDDNSKLLICYFNDIIDELLNDNKIKEVSYIKGVNNIPIYQMNNDIFLVKGYVGEPLMGSILEFLIRQGLKKILFIGGAGVLVNSNRGDLFVIKEALRDEGLSYHYSEASRYVLANLEVLNIITKYLNEHNINYTLANTWSIDAIYRETKAKIELRKKEGLMLVEMEQAGLIALTNFYKVKYGALIYAGDDLSKETHDLRLSTKTNYKYELFKIAINILNLF